MRTASLALVVAEVALATKPLAQKPQMGEFYVRNQAADKSKLLIPQRLELVE